MQVVVTYIVLIVFTFFSLPCLAHPKLPVGKKIPLNSLGKVGGVSAEEFIKKTMANPSFVKGLCTAEREDLAKSLELAVSRRINDQFLASPKPILSTYARASQVEGVEFIHPVWKLEDSLGNALGFLKMGNLSEIERTKQFHEVVKDILPKFDLIDVEYPRVLTEGYEHLPPALIKQLEIETNTDFFRRYVRSAETRSIIPFLLSVVNTRGLTLALQYHWKNANWSLSFFRDKPLSAAEWGQIRGFVRAFNEAGFSHGDIPRNFHLRRGVDERIKITILDFEKNVSKINDDFFFEEWEELLLEQGCLVL
jgi:hypothetical protein